jgi:hypothetical protein
MPIKYVEGVDNHNVGVGGILVFINRITQTRLEVSRGSQIAAELTAPQPKNKLCQACNHKLSAPAKALLFAQTPTRSSLTTQNSTFPSPSCKDIALLDHAAVRILQKQAK